jgi:hypothetical protein
MNSVFTESYAAYLFIILAIVMMICGFIFKDKGGKWLFYLAMFGFLMAGFYCFAVQASLTAFIHWLGLFCVLAALGNMLMPIILREKKPPPEVTRPMTTDEYVADMRVRRYGRLPGHDKDGHKVNQGW